MGRKVRARKEQKEQARAAELKQVIMRQLRARADTEKKLQAKILAEAAKAEQDAVERQKKVTWLLKAGADRKTLEAMLNPTEDGEWASMIRGHDLDFKHIDRRLDEMISRLTSESPITIEAVDLDLTIESGADYSDRRIAPDPLDPDRMV